jgi:cell fate (sporulation/competence/biofilm development) regulator YmcA (YheA/YmcA/DUF963 family)
VLTTQQGSDKRIGKLKRKIKEMTVIDEYIKSENALLKDSSVRFQEEISRLKKDNKKSLRKAQQWYRQAKKLHLQNQRLKTKIERIQPGTYELNVFSQAII